MLKKTLLAVTLAALSTGAMAVDVTGSVDQDYGHESLTNGETLNDGSVLKLGNDSNVAVVRLKLGAAYAVGDLITIKLSGGKFLKTETFTLEQNTPNRVNEIVLGFLSVTDTEVVFRVTSTKGTTSGLILLLDNGTFVGGRTPAVANKLILDSTAVGSKVTISASAVSSAGTAIDTAGVKSSKVIATVIQEHKFEVDPAMAAIIDVSKARKEFVSTPASSFVLKYTGSVADQASFVIASAKYTLNGSFTGFEKSVPATDNDGSITTLVTTTPTELTVAADLQSAAITVTAALPVSQTFTFAVDGTPADRTVLNAGNYTADVVLTKGTHTTTIAGLAAGSHTLNGANAQFAYVPVNFVGAVTSQFEIGNKSKIDGEITLSGFDSEGNNYSEILPFPAGAGKLTKIGDDDIAEAFGLTKGTKLNLTITVNAPATDITFGGYSNRGTTGRMSLQKL